MRIYLAASYGRRKELLRYANEIEAVGHTITSRWLRGRYEHEDQKFDNGDDATRLRVGQPHALQDIRDVDACDAFVLFAGNGNSARGGRHFEMGLAYGLSKQCHVIGRRENVFHCLPEIRFHTSWQDFLIWIGNVE